MNFSCGFDQQTGRATLLRSAAKGFPERTVDREIDVRELVIVTRKYERWRMTRLGQNEAFHFKLGNLPAESDFVGRSFHDSLFLAGRYALSGFNFNPVDFNPSSLSHGITFPRLLRETKRKIHGHSRKMAALVTVPVRRLSSL